jgi:lipid-binding SYLF domain-containing protein
MRTLALTAFLIAFSAQAADKEAAAIDRLELSADVFNALMQTADKGIPQDLLDHSKCVVIVPGLKKAGFIFGGKYGRGYALCRKATGRGWSAPAAMRVEGGSVGFQIGASEQDVVLLVKNGDGMKHLLADKFTIGGDATAAAGPLGRDASAQTDAELHAEMLSYSRSRGLFAGISLEGATLRPDGEANNELYGRELSNREILTGNVAPPKGAHKLEAALNTESSRRVR